MSKEKGSKSKNKSPYEPLRDGESKRYRTLHEEKVVDPNIQHNQRFCNWANLRKYVLSFLITSTILGLIITLILKLNCKSASMDPCQGKSIKKLFPNIDYAMYGFNILYAYPLATGHNPGLTHPIFEPDYSGSKHTADCKYKIPHGYHLVQDVACVVSFTSEIVKDASQFSESMSVFAEVSGKAWGVSFAASSEYKKISSVMSATESVFIFSKASCNYYFAKLNEQNPPALTNDFMNYVKDIRNVNDTHKLFDYYGTHFTTYTLFGARFIYEYKMSQKSFQEESRDELSISAKASYSGAFSLGGKVGMTYKTGKAVQRFLSKAEKKTISIGALPPANGDTNTWASTVKDTPIPVQYKLESIENLFTDRFMKGLDIDYINIKKLIKSGKKTYCQSLKIKGIFF